MKVLVTAIILLVVFLSLAPTTYAIDFCPFGQFGNLCQLNPNDHTNLVGNIFNILLITAVLLSIGFLIMGGIKWIAAGGDKSKIDSARNTVTGAIIGLVIAFSAFSVISFVNYFFSVDSTGTVFQLPRLNNSPNRAGATYRDNLPECSTFPDPELALQNGQCK